jgi:hypothetical protein
MQFQVPQFTDIEDKVIGPFTLKQFLYVAGAAGLLFILFKILKFFVFLLLAIPIVGLTIALAFIKVHNQSFISVIKNFFGFLRKPDFYVWKKPKAKIQTKKEKTPEIVKTITPKRRTRKKPKQGLQEIEWKINIQK